MNKWDFKTPNGFPLGNQDTIYVIKWLLINSEHCYYNMIEISLHQQACYFWKKLLEVALTETEIVIGQQHLIVKA